MHYPSVRVDDDVWRWLQRKALPFEDTSNSVLRRLARLNGVRARKGKSERIPRGERTVQETFRKPILRALYEMGGSGKTAEVLDKVGEILGDLLTDADRAAMKHGQIRWRNTAQWRRYAMVEEGLLKKKSARGIWELTERGVKLAEQELR